MINVDYFNNRSVVLFFIEFFNYYNYRHAYDVASTWQDFDYVVCVHLLSRLKIIKGIGQEALYKELNDWCNSQLEPDGWDFEDLLVLRDMETIGDSRENEYAQVRDGVRSLFFFERNFNIKKLRQTPIDKLDIEIQRQIKIIKDKQ